MLDIKMLLDSVMQKYNTINRRLPSARGIVESNDFLSDSLHIMQSEMNDYYFARVTSWEKKIRSALLCHRVNRMKDILNEFGEHADKLIGFLNERVSPRITSTVGNNSSNIVPET